MKRIFFVIIALSLAVSLLTINVSAASKAMDAAVLELGQLKVCKVAGAGVPEGKPFTIKVENNSYSVPAGAGDGFCVLAGQYAVGTQVTVQEEISAGYYVSQIESKPDRAVSMDVAQGKAIIQVGSGVTEIIFTNNAIGLPTLTPKPTKTPTPTPDCAQNCDPTPTPSARGRLQICKEADGAGVTGYFTFHFAARSVTIPVGACSDLMTVSAGPLTITEEAQAGYAVTDIYTIPPDRLKRENHDTRKATVTIVEGFAASQTIVVFRNAPATTTTVTPTNTPTNTPVTHTPTNTATGTALTGTPTFTPTATNTGTPAACVPEVVVPDFNVVPVGSPVEGLGTIDPRLNIDAKGTAVHIHEGLPPSVYASTVNGVNIMNAGMTATAGFSDPTSQLNVAAHQYTFTFAPGVTVSNLSLHMLDFGDYNPTGSSSHLVTITGYNANGAAVASQQLSYTTDANFVSPQFGPMQTAGDAINSSPGQPGDWMWNLSGTGMVRVVLDFGLGYDPNMGLHLLSFTVECATTPPPGSATLSSPSGTVSTASPTYTWNKVNNSTWYYLWVNNASGTPVVQQWYESSAVCGATTCSATPAVTLGDGAYTWWIQTWNDGGNGPWSNGMSFSVATIPPPGAASPVSPSGPISDTTPLYTWSRVSTSTWYYLWINQLNPDGTQTTMHNTWYESSAVCSGSTCSFSPAVTLSTGNYRWWVQTWNEGGFGPWSSSLDFSIP